MFDGKTPNTPPNPAPIPKPPLAGAWRNLTWREGMHGRDNPPLRSPEARRPEHRTALGGAIRLADPKPDRNAGDGNVRPPDQTGCDPRRSKAPKGRPIPARGKAPGPGHNHIPALKGRPNRQRSRQSVGRTYFFAFCTVCETSSGAVPRIPVPRIPPFPGRLSPAEKCWGAVPISSWQRWSGSR